MVHFIVSCIFPLLERYSNTEWKSDLEAVAANALKARECKSENPVFIKLRALKGPSTLFIPGL